MIAIIFLLSTLGFAGGMIIAWLDSQEAIETNEQTDSNDL